jgi:hypothetical protein
MERTLLLHTQNGRNNSSCLSVWYAPRRQLQPRAFTHACQSSIKNGCSALFWLVYAQVHTGMHRYTGVQVCTGTVYRYAQGTVYMCTCMHKYAQVYRYAQVLCTCVHKVLCTGTVYRCTGVQVYRYAQVYRCTGMHRYRVQEYRYAQVPCTGVQVCTGIW